MATADYEKFDGALSPTGVQAYIQCPLKWYRRYREGKRESATAAMMIGTVCHGALERFTKAKGQETIENCLNQSMAANDIIEFGDFAACQKMVKIGAETVDHNRLLATEQSFAFPFGDVNITGFIDRVDRISDDTIEVIDYKTGLNPKSSWEMESDLQLAMYYVAARGLWPQFPNVITSMLYLRTGKKVTQGGEDELVPRLYEYLRGVVDRIEAGQFAPRINRYCVYCHVKHECEEYMKLDERLRALLEQPTTDPAAAFARYERFAEISSTSEKEKKGLQEQLIAQMEAAGVGEQTVGERVYSTTQRVTRDTDTRIAFNILQNYGVPMEEILAAMSFGASALDELLERHAAHLPGLEDTIKTAQRMKATSSWLTSKALTPKLRKGSGGGRRKS